jgi:UDP-N-acetylglucosamine 2-epimerase (non-hydrolysing)
MRKVLAVFGTRPEAIKLAPVLKELHARPAEFAVQCCVTAQHRDLLDQVLRLFRIETDYDLDLMTPGQSLFDVTDRVLAGVGEVLARARPDLVLVQGDTTTTMAASLAAFYLKIPVAHVEAGLRTRDKRAPFPEEINRRVTSCIADFHFAPTAVARANLLAEGIAPQSVWVTGNTVVDALQEVRAQIRSDAALEQGLKERFAFLDAGRKLILVTGHRREKFGAGLEDICKALKTIAERRLDVEVVYPVHPNPSVREPVMRLLGGGKLRNLHVIEPLDYLAFVYLLIQCRLVLTDSGGIQEEAPSLGKPVLVLRDTTERMEAVEAGRARLVGSDPEAIFAGTVRLLDDERAYAAMAGAGNPFGDGMASRRIADALASVLA